MVSCAAGETRWGTTWGGSEFCLGHIFLTAGQAEEPFLRGSPSRTPET